jgi:hypothetical protein
MSLPGLGTALLGVAWLMGPIAIALEIRKAGRAGRMAQRG